MASVLPRTAKNGTVTWRVQYRLNGTMKQKTFTHFEGAEQFGQLIDKHGAESALKIHEARVAAPSDVPTLREWVNTYLDPTSGLLTGVEPATRSGYRQAADRSFLPLLGDYPVDAITKADVGRWIAWQEDQPSRWRNGKVSAKTVRNYHAILSAAMQAAVQTKLRDENPAYRTRMTRGVKREGVFLSTEEFATLLHFIPQRYEGFVLFLAGTGCRWGEATALTWGDFTPAVAPSARRPKGAPATIRISKAWKKGVGGTPVLKYPKSARSRRTISLDPDTVAAMGTPGPADQLVFPGRTGNHMWHKSFRINVWIPSVKKAQDPELCEKYGLEPLRQSPNIHDLRHTHASWLIAAGAPLPYVQARLGHESINTTVNVYGHLQPDAHVEMADIMANTLANVRPLRQIDP